ncbi:unnamed protein product [Lathyrus oleraceus]
MSRIQFLHPQRIKNKMNMCEILTPKRYEVGVASDSPDRNSYCGQASVVMLDDVIASPTETTPSDSCRLPNSDADFRWF